jgi:hypothetical protein
MPLFEQLQIIIKNVQFASLTTGDLLQNPELFQVGDQFICRGRRNAHHLSGFRCVNHGTLIQIMDKLLGVRRSAAKGSYLVLHLLLQLEDIFKGHYTAFRRFDNANQKKT